MLQGFLAVMVCIAENVGRGRRSCEKGPVAQGSLLKL